MTRIVEVLPDVSGIDRTFAYEVPDELSAQDRASAPSSGWSCTDGACGDGSSPRRVDPPGDRAAVRGRGGLLRSAARGRRARPLGGVALCRPAAAGARRGVASPARASAAPAAAERPVPARPSRRAGERRDGRRREARRAGPPTPPASSARSQQPPCRLSPVRPRVLRLPPAAPRLAVVEAALEAGAGRRRPARARRPRARTRRRWRIASCEPGTPWRSSPRRGRRRPRAAGSSSAPARAVLAPVAAPERHRRARRPRRLLPGGAGADLGGRRGRRRAGTASRRPLPAGEPLPERSTCSPAGRLVTLSRDAERTRLGAGRADRRQGRGPPRGRLSLAAGLGDPCGGRERPGPSRRCRAQPEGTRLACSPAALPKPAALRRLRRGARPARTRRRRASRPCSTALRARLRARRRAPSCGPTRPRIVRPGVARVREDLAALTGLEVAEVGRASSGARLRALPDAPVLIGTEAVLHRAGSASMVVFPDFDHELLAPRYRAGEQALALLALASRLVGRPEKAGPDRGPDSTAGPRGAGRGPARRSGAAGLGRRAAAGRCCACRPRRPLPS